MQCSGNIVTDVFASAVKTLAVEDVRQFDTYEDGMISHCAWYVDNIIPAFDGIHRVQKESNTFVLL